MYRPKRFNNRGNKPRFQKRGPSKLDPRLLIRKAEDMPVVEDYQPRYQFQDFPIKDELQQNIEAKGYDIPTPIQDQAIIPILEGKDVIGLANTGTGKTAAFTIPLIDKILRDPSQKVLILAPTRELAVQIHQEFLGFAKGTSITSSLCIGGANMQVQIMQVRNSPNFIIGTPGRMKDLVMSKKLQLFRYQNIVLDEVDRMLDIGFIRDIEFLLGQMPKDKQSLFFSATLSQEIQGLVYRFMKQPIMISVKKQETSNNVEQDVIRIGSRIKLDVLHDMLALEECKKVLVFGRTKHGVEKLSKTLYVRGFKTASIHGNKSQNQRQRALEEFKANKIQVLLATDVAARGLDIPNVTHVINYDLPATYEEYVHRIGRTGRAGQKGFAVSFVD